MTNVNITSNFHYAQNYPQLFNQASVLNYSSEELKLLKHAFDFAQVFANGVYRAQGIPLINHLVRTASIVMSQQQSMSLVVVSLLHAVFVIHKFDQSVRTSNIAARQQEVSSLFSQQISEQILAYEAMHWYKKDVIDDYIANIEQLSEQTKNLLLVRLANELEDHLDLAMSYSSDERIQFRSLAYGDACVALAKKLGYRDLGKQFAAILIEQQAFIPKEFLRVSAKQGYELTCVKWPMTAIERCKRYLKRKLRIVT